MMATFTLEELKEQLERLGKKDSIFFFAQLMITEIKNLTPQMRNKSMTGADDIIGAVFNGKLPDKWFKENIFMTEKKFIHFMGLEDYNLEGKIETYQFAISDKKEELIVTNHDYKEVVADLFNLLVLKFLFIFLSWVKNKKDENSIFPYLEEITVYKLIEPKKEWY